MSDLDEKLVKAISDTIWVNAIDNKVKQRVHPYWFTANGQTFTFGVDSERITQAFKDAGWFGPEDEAKVQTIRDVLAQLDADVKRYIFGGGIEVYQNATLDAIKKEAGLMSGQEWYDRFIQELGDEPLKRDSLLVMQEFHAAAKKAAGIDDDNRKIVTITLDCGHIRTQDANVDDRHYGHKDVAKCKTCNAPELISTIISKARKAAGVE